MFFRYGLGMIMSVSTLIMSSGAAVPRSWLNLSIVLPPAPRSVRRLDGRQRADIRPPAGHPRRRRHRRAHQVSTSAAPLPALDDRKTHVEGKSVSVSVDIGGRRTL